MASRKNGTDLQDRNRDSDAEDRFVDISSGKEREGQIERAALTYMHWHV